MLVLAMEFSRGRRVDSADAGGSEKPASRAGPRHSLKTEQRGPGVNRRAHCRETEIYDRGDARGAN
jgi:hypothetical protein